MVLYHQDGSIETLLPKISHAKSQLLSKETYKTLLDSNDLEEFISKLRDSSYGELKIEMKTTLYSIEYDLKEILIKLFKKLLRHAPKNYQAFFRTYLLKYEIENIKKMLRGVHANLSSEEILNSLHISIEDVFKRRKILEESLDALDLHSFVHNLSVLPYGEVIREAFLIFERERSSFFYFDLLLELFYLQQLWKAHLKLKGKNRAIIRKFIGFKIDCYNLETIFRAKRLQLNEALMFRMIFGDYSHYLNQEILDGLIRGQFKIERLYKIFKLQKQAPVNFQDPESVNKFYRREVADLIRFYYLNSDFDIGKPFAFIKNKELEVKNLRTISIGIQYQISTQEVMDKLILIDPY